MRPAFRFRARSIQPKAWAWSFRLIGQTHQRRDHGDDVGNRNRIPARPSSRRRSERCGRRPSSQPRKRQRRPDARHPGPQGRAASSSTGICAGQIQKLDCGRINQLEAKPPPQSVEGIAVVQSPGAGAAADLLAEPDDRRELRGGPPSRLAVPGVRHRAANDHPARDAAGESTGSRNRSRSIRACSEPPISASKPGGIRKIQRSASRNGKGSGDA